MRNWQMGQSGSREFNSTQNAILVTLATFALAQQAQSAPPKPGDQPIKLICSGTITDTTISVNDTPVTGVYVVIDENAASIYNVPTFPNYQAGMTFDVYDKNPSKLWMQNRSNEAIVSTINRITGDIYVEETAPSRDRMLRWFTGKCANPKPVF